MEASTNTDKILAIDIGGSHVKTMLLDAAGNALEERRRTVTPQPASPEAIIAVIKDLASQTGEFTKAAAGFPGFIKNGIIQTAPNLGTPLWQGTNLSQKLEDVLGKPVIVVNDADFQGAGLVSGKGFEIVITLGTGFGTALLKDGVLLPHLEISQHPITKTKNYDTYIGVKAYTQLGKKKWNLRLQKMLAILKTVFNYDHLYISGGNAKNINFKPGENITLDTNTEGFKGAAKLWAAAERVIGN